MKCNSQASFLAHTLANPCLGRKPKARVTTLAKFGGLGMEKLIRKVVSMGCDGSNIFQGHRTNVTL